MPIHTQLTDLFLVLCPMCYRLPLVLRTESTAILSLSPDTSKAASLSVPHHVKLQS